MARQAVVAGFPFPFALNETNQRQAVGPGGTVNETSPTTSTTYVLRGPLVTRIVGRDARVAVGSQAWMGSVDLGLYYPVVAAPFYGTDFPNPMRAADRFAVFNRTHLDPLKLNLLGQDAFFAGPGAGPSYDYPNPLRANDRFHVALRTHVDVLRLNLLGQDVFFGLAGSPNFDQPNPAGLAPRLRFPVSNRTHTDPVRLNLLGQDKMFGAPGEAQARDFPNPIPYRRAPDLRTHLNPVRLQLLGQDRFFRGPGVGPNYDYPNPLIKGRLNPPVGHFNPNVYQQPPPSPVWSPLTASALTWSGLTAGNVTWTALTAGNVTWTVIPPPSPYEQS